MERDLGSPEDQPRLMEFTVLDELYRESLRLREEFLRRPLGLALTEEDTSKDADLMHFGAVDQGNLIASVSVQELECSRVQIKQMVVHSDHQGRGIGARLIRHVEEEIRKRGFRQIEMDARVSAEGFYRKSGYKAGEEIYEQVGIDHKRMKKRL